MKNTYTLLSLFFSLFFYSVAAAQSNNKTKIIGCWEVKQIIFTKEPKDSDEISSEAIGSMVCFDKDGKFSNKMGGNVIKGNYKLSENGKTIYQGSESDDDANSAIENVPGQIIILNDTELQIQAEEVVFVFRRNEH